MLLSIVILIPLLGAWLPTALSRALGVDPARTAAALAATSLALILSQAPDVLAGATLVSGWSWIPAAGLNATFRLDGLALLFALLILGIGAAGHPVCPLLPVAARIRRRASTRCLLLFMGAMLGIVLADNLLLLVVFWELTSLASFLLIGFWQPSRRRARRARAWRCTVTGAGGLALLAGVLLLGHDRRQLRSRRRARRAATVDPRRTRCTLPMLVLVLLGAFTKSAQFPFHFWLPHAMAAPTPVVRLPAFRHHGEGRRLPAGAAVSGAGRAREPWFYVVSGTGLVDACCSAPTSRCSSTT